MRYRVERIGIHLTAFLIARCELFSMYPFVVSFFMAAYLQERSGMSLFLVMMLGLISKAGYVQAVRYSSVLLFLLVLLKSTDRKRVFADNIQIAMASGVVLCAVTMPYQYMVTGQDGCVLFALLEGIITSCMILIMEQGLIAFHVGASRIFATNERFIGVFAILTIVLFGCPNLKEPFHLLFALSSYMVLYCVYQFESSVGMAMGGVTGLVLGLRMERISYLAVMLLLSSVAICLKKLGKVGILLSFMAGMILLGLFFEPDIQKTPILIAALLAEGMLVLTPRSNKSKVKENGKKNSDVSLMQEIVTNRVRDFGQAFLMMEKILTLREQERGQMHLDGLSNIYLSGDGISLLNMVESESNRLQEIRKNFIRQFGQIGEIITSFQGNMQESIDTIGFMERKMMEWAERMDIEMTRIVSSKGQNDRMEIYISCYSRGQNRICGRQMAEQLGRVVQRAMICVEKGEHLVGREEEIFSFVEEGKYMLTTGVKQRKRSGENQCGDNYSVIKLDSQKAVVMLSDGMGCGASAFDKSEQVVELLEQLLQAGFDRELAIELLNSFISFLSDGTVSSTLDLMMLDFYTGSADFVKLGASSTFIKHGKKVECIHSTSLPVGVLEQVEFDTCKRLLYHGDIVVMVSDGVLDSIVFENKEEYLADIIAQIDTCNVQAVAEYIMKEIVSMQHGTLNDDSTVLVAGVWER